MKQVSMMALAPHVQQLLEYLKKYPGERFTYDDRRLRDAFPRLAPSTFSWHLWALHKRGLIRRERVGRRVYVFYPPTTVQENGGSETVSKLTFTVMLERDEDGYIVASCPALPGCHTQGRSREEALANIREAIRGYIASMRRHGEEIPQEDLAQVEVEVGA